MAFTPFSRVPLEIRQKIFSEYFAASPQTYPRLETSPLLLTSRQLHAEAQPFYWKETCFDLGTTKNMLDLFTSISHDTLCKIRHISLIGFPLPLYPDEERYCYRTHFFDYVLLLFPGLQLSTLRVRDPYEWSTDDGWGHDAAYSIVDSFINCQGFKQLIYVVEYDRFLKRNYFGTVNNGVHGRMECSQMDMASLYRTCSRN
ncbi:MAG: hypothetical protein Q9222_001148 [Ikaeria aurantiellina]